MSKNSSKQQYERRPPALPPGAAETHGRLHTAGYTHLVFPRYESWSAMPKPAKVLQIEHAFVENAGRKRPSSCRSKLLLRERGLPKCEGRLLACCKHPKWRVLPLTNQELPSINMHKQRTCKRMSNANKIKGFAGNTTFLFLCSKKNQCKSRYVVARGGGCVRNSSLSTTKMEMLLAICNARPPRRLSAPRTLAPGIAGSPLDKLSTFTS